MTEPLPDEPGYIIIARRALAEAEAWVRVAEAFSEIQFMKMNEALDIRGFLDEWEAGQVSE